ncbi:MAG: hypothetical protein OEP52_05935 [Acidimicrobiia bacterium]|nr:hypothetical protein [Acidimicrobiia bacterium]
MGLASAVVAVVLLVTADVWAVRAVSDALDPMRASVERSDDDLTALSAALDRSAAALALVTATVTDTDETLTLTEVARGLLEVEAGRVREDISTRIASASLEAERIDQSSAVFDALVPIEVDTTRASSILDQLEALDRQADEVLEQLDGILAAPPGPIEIPLAEVDRLRDRIDAGDLVVDGLGDELEAAHTDLNDAERRMRRTVHLTATTALLLILWFAAGQWALATFTPPGEETDELPQ